MIYNIEKKRRIDLFNASVMTAFSSTLYPGDESIFDDSIYRSVDFAHLRVARCFLGKKWTEVDLSLVTFHHPYQLSLVGAFYFLPAIMLSSVIHSVSSEIWYFLVKYIYDDATNHYPEFNTQKMEIKILLDINQKCVVVEFLSLLAEMKDEYALAALAGSWAEFR